MCFSRIMFDIDLSFNPQTIFTFFSLYLPPRIRWRVLTSTDALCVCVCACTCTCVIAIVYKMCISQFLFIFHPDVLNVVNVVLVAATLEGQVSIITSDRRHMHHIHQDPLTPHTHTQHIHTHTPTALSHYCLSRPMPTLSRYLNKISLMDRERWRDRMRWREGEREHRQKENTDGPDR